MAYYFNRCVNCTILLNYHFPRPIEVLKLDTSLRAILLSWISHMQVLSEHRLCGQCFEILKSQAQNDAPTRGYGHKSICLGCGKSLLRRVRNFPINKSRREYTLIIQSWVPQIKADLPVFKKYCAACMRKARRHIAVNTKQDNKVLYTEPEMKRDNDEMPEAINVVKNELPEVKNELPDIKIEMDYPDLFLPEEDLCDKYRNVEGIFIKREP